MPRPSCRRNLNGLWKPSSKPRLAASAREHAGEVAFLGIDVEDLTSDARRFLRRYRVNYVSARDGGGSTYDDYGLTGVPAGWAAHHYIR